MVAVEKLKVCWQNSGGALTKDKGKCIGLVGKILEKLRIKVVWGLEDLKNSIKLYLGSNAGELSLIRTLYLQKFLRVGIFQEPVSWRLRLVTNPAMLGGAFSVQKR
jgi:hypothetical protein